MLDRVKAADPNTKFMVKIRVWKQGYKGVCRWFGIGCVPRAPNWDFSAFGLSKHTI
jgi:hypothetical protein